MKKTLQKVCTFLLIVLFSIGNTYAMTEDDTPNLIMENAFIRFTDIQGHAYEQAINYLADKGIVQGYEDSTFRPDILIDRGSFVKMIVESLNVYSMKRGNPFKDVKEEWFAKYIWKAKDLGIVQGFSDGTFRPYKSVSFAEALAMSFRAHDISVPQEQGKEWYQGYLDLAQSLSFTSQKKPSDFITRAEMAEIIYWMKDYAPKLKLEKIIQEELQLQQNESPDQKKYRELISNSQEAMFTSGELQAYLSVNIQPTNSYAEEMYFKMSTNINSAIDSEVEGKEKVSMDIDAQGTFKEGMSETGSVLFNANIISLEETNTLYAKLNKFEIFSSLIDSMENSGREISGALTIDEAIKPYLNQWWKFSNTSNNMESVPLQSFFISVNIDQEKIKQAGKTSSLITVQEDKGIEKINGKDAYHYVVVIDKAGILRHSQKIASVMGEELSRENIASIKRFLKKLENQKFDIWLDVQNKHLSKIAMTDMTASFPDKDISITTTLELTFTPKSVSIEAPAGAKDFEEQ